MVSCRHAMYMYIASFPAQIASKPVLTRVSGDFFIVTGASKIKNEMAVHDNFFELVM